ncbi:MAG: hypothetical protein JWQ09_4130 [Segetibacter sp.]|nr:hypothetical protein [Segetibacter sp.]
MNINNYKETIDYNKLQQIVVVANTPMYLFSNFQGNQSVLELFSSLSDQELITAFYAELNNKRDLKNLVTLYALIVALWYKDSAYVDGFFTNLKNMHDVKWASSFSDLYFSKTSYSTFEKTIQPNLSYYDSLDISNSESKQFEFL